MLRYAIKKKKTELKGKCGTEKSTAAEGQLLIQCFIGNHSSDECLKINEYAALGPAVLDE